MGHGKNISFITKFLNHIGVCSLLLLVLINFKVNMFPVFFIKLKTTRFFFSEFSIVGSICLKLGSFPLSSFMSNLHLI